jgi:hypothetical protein
MKPNGFDLLALLVELLADQEGVKITYELTDGKTTVQKTTGRKADKKWKKAS